MLPLYDMLAHAGRGQAMERMARQFGLTAEQTEAAFEALLPAFSQGLKRNAADPYGLGAFVAALASGQHARFFDDPAAALSPDGRAAGEQVLGQLFGSRELSRAVARYAAAATGLAEETMKQMLPAMAAMIMGGLHKQTTGAMAGAAGTEPPFAAMMRQMAGGAGTAPAGLDNPFLRMAQGSFSGGARTDAPRGGALPGNPFAAMLAAMTGGATSQDDAPPPPRTPSGRPVNAYDELFGEMFEAGRKTREAYREGMAAVFDRFARPPSPGGGAP